VDGNNICSGGYCRPNTANWMNEKITVDGAGKTLKPGVYRDPKYVWGRLVGGEVYASQGLTVHDLVINGGPKDRQVFRGMGGVVQTGACDPKKTGLDKCPTTGFVGTNNRAAYDAQIAIQAKEIEDAKAAYRAGILVDCPISAGSYPDGNKKLTPYGYTAPCVKGKSYVAPVPAAAGGSSASGASGGSSASGGGSRAPGGSGRAPPKGGSSPSSGGSSVLPPVMAKVSSNMWVWIGIAVALCLCCVSSACGVFMMMQ
jgi:hypothetical protein